MRLLMPLIRVASLMLSIGSTSDAWCAAEKASPPKRGKIAAPPRRRGTFTDDASAAPILPASLPPSRLLSRYDDGSAAPGDRHPLGRLEPAVRRYCRRGGLSALGNATAKKHRHEIDEAIFQFQRLKEKGRQPPDEDGLRAPLRPLAQRGSQSTGSWL